MLKRVQHDKKKYVIPNLFRNLGFGNDNELIAFVLVSRLRNTLINLGATFCQNLVHTLFIDPVIPAKAEPAPHLMRGIQDS
jgi:hypothetical protein